MAKQVLVIDDNQNTVKYLSVVLSEHGYEPSSACDGEEGLQKLQQSKPDLIILDVMMDSTTDGFHASYTLKKDPVYKEIPVVMLTAIGKRTGMHFDRKEDEDYLPVEEFIEKPVDPKVLVSTVKKYVS